MSIVRMPPKEPEYLQPFLAYCKKRRYSSKVDIIHAGEPADCLLYLIEGSVSIIIEDEEGHEIVLAYLNKGEFVGEMGLFSPESRPTRSGLVRTRAECEIAEIAYTRLEGLFETDLKAYSRDILYAIGTQITTRLINTSQKVGNLAFLDVTGRIAGTLRDLCKQPDAMTHPDGMQIRVTRQELGRIVGCSREMAGRVLKNLEEQGLISVKGKTIVVFDAR